MKDLSEVSDEDLIILFNKEVLNPGSGFERIKRLSSIREEFLKRGFDFSEIGDEKGINFSKTILLKDKKIIIKD